MTIQRSQQRTAQRVVRTSLNRFEIDASKIPPNMRYEWKRKKLMGMEDTNHLINLEINGWSPVPQDRHPERFGSRMKTGAEIEQDGLVLMEIPIEVAQESVELDKFAAKNQVAQQMQRLGMEGRRVPGSKGIKTEYVPDRQVVDD